MLTQSKQSFILHIFQVWASVHDLLMKVSRTEPPPAEPTEEPPPKKERKSIFFSSSSSSDSEADEDSLEQCLARYRAEPKLDIKGCPLEWWSKRETSHPVLATIARKYLSTPATTVPCERLFSLSGHIVQKRRASLSPENVNRLVCLNNWLSG